MRAPAAVALGVYALLMGTLATPLYEPLSEGRDDSWVVVLLLAGAHFGIGLAVGRIWVLGIPTVLCLVAFLASGAEGLATLILVFELPGLLIATGAGVLTYQRSRGGASTGLLGVSLALALVPVVWAAWEQLDRAGSPRVSAQLQRQLPTDGFLGSLCLGSELPRKEFLELRRSGEVLIREVRRQPGSLVTNTYVPADSPDVEHKDITVRELGEEQLRSLRDDDEHCAPALERRLAQALD